MEFEFADDTGSDYERYDEVAADHAPEGRVREGVGEEGSA